MSNPLLESNTVELKWVGLSKPELEWVESNLWV